MQPETGVRYITINSKFYYEELLPTFLCGTLFQQVEGKAILCGHDIVVVVVVIGVRKPVAGSYVLQGYPSKYKKFFSVYSVGAQHRPQE